MAQLTKFEVNEPGSTISAPTAGVFALEQVLEIEGVGRELLDTAEQVGRDHHWNDAGLVTLFRLIPG